MPTQPQWPAVTETYADFDVTGWFGVVAMNGMSPAIIERVNRDINEVLAVPEVKERFATFALFAKPMSTPAFATFLTRQRSRWEQVLRDVGAPAISQ